MDSRYLGFHSHSDLLTFMEENSNAIGFFSYPIVSGIDFLEFIEVSTNKDRVHRPNGHTYLPTSPDYPYIQPLHIAYRFDVQPYVLDFLASIFTDESQDLFAQHDYFSLNPQEVLKAQQDLYDTDKYIVAAGIDSSCEARLPNEIKYIGALVSIALLIILFKSIGKIDYREYTQEAKIDKKTTQVSSIDRSDSLHSTDVESEMGSMLSRSDSFGVLDVFVTQKPTNNLRDRMCNEAQIVEINTYKDIWPYYSMPLFWQSSFSVIEPWEHVGEHNGVEVRASQNFYNFFSRIMGSHTMVFPIYSEDFEIEEHDEFVAYLSQSACIVVEGGDQSTYDSDTFVESLSQKQLFTLTSKLILSRGINTCPQIYICLGHQCTAEAHVWILKEFVTQMEGKRHFKDLSPLIRAADDIRAMGESLKIIRRNGDMVCQGWEHPMFAVRNMLQKEIGLSTLEEYTFKERHISEELVKAYKENEVFFSKSTRNLDLFGRSVPMFHGDEVNPEAIYFANWAYLKLHPIVEKCKQYIIGTSLVTNPF